MQRCVALLLASQSAHVNKPLTKIITKLTARPWYFLTWPHVQLLGLGLWFDIAKISNVTANLRTTEPTDKWLWIHGLKDNTKPHPHAAAAYFKFSRFLWIIYIFHCLLAQRYNASPVFTYVTCSWSLAYGRLISPFYYITTTTTPSTTTTRRGYTEKSSQHHFHLHLWHALLKCSVPCWTYQPHSTQRTTGAQLFWLYCATDVMLTSLTPTSTRSCTSLTLKSSFKISSYP